MSSVKKQDKYITPKIAAEILMITTRIGQNKNFERQMTNRVRMAKMKLLNQKNLKLSATEINKYAMMPIYTAEKAAMGHMGGMNHSIPSANKIIAQARIAAKLKNGGKIMNMVSPSKSPRRSRSISPQKKSPMK